MNRMARYYYLLLDIKNEIGTLSIRLLVQVVCIATKQ